jgi:hypothetical protein
MPDAYKESLMIDRVKFIRDNNIIMEIDDVMKLSEKSWALVIKAVEPGYDQYQIIPTNDGTGISFIWRMKKGTYISETLTFIHHNVQVLHIPEPRIPFWVRKHWNV